MTKKSLLTLITSVVLIIVFITLGVGISCKAPAASTITAPAPTAEIRWKSLRPFSLDATDSIPYNEFLARVNKQAKGRLVIDDVGGAEVFPTSQQFAPLALGKVDLLYTAGSYIPNDFPELLLGQYCFGVTPSQARSIGLYDRLDEIGRTEHGVKLLGLPYYAAQGMYLTKPIKTLADLKGLKIRSSAGYDIVIKPQGIPTVSVSVSELFTALSTGTVDGMMFVGYDLVTYGLDKAIKYRLAPPLIVSIGDPFLANLKSWDALPKDLQDLLLNIMIGLEKEAPSMFAVPVAKEWSILKAAGVQEITLSNADWLETQRGAYEVGLPERLQQVTPSHAKELLKYVSQLYPPKEEFKW